MGENTAISWTGATWNPWHGCLKISPGCKHCYMYRDKARYGQDPMIVSRSKTTFNEPLKWQDSRLIFTCSWSDFFIQEADDWREDAWDVIRRTPQHTYQILTKRPERIAAHLPSDWGIGWENVWLGVSVENQEYADKRIPLLIDTPAIVRFLSCEPLLDGVDLSYWLNEPENCCPQCGAEVIRGYGNSYQEEKRLLENCVRCQQRFGQWVNKINWVIVGGESGSDYRPLNLEHACSLRDQCVAANTPFFFKQVGGVRPTSGGDLLDGKQWHQMPRQVISKAFA